jgi:Domain of unknown function (DUF4760)
MQFRRGYPLWNQHLGWFLFWVGSVVTVVGAVAWNLSRSDANRGVLLASLLATVGWLITVHATRANERRKATIDLVLRHHMDRSIEDHKYRILRAFPPYSVIDAEQAAKVMADYRAWAGDAGDGGTSKPPVGFAIIQVLNFYEFIAVGVRRGRLDEGVAFDSFAALSRNMLIKFGNFIALCRPAASDGKASRTYSDLVWLAKRWHKLNLNSDPVPPRPAEGHWAPVADNPQAASEVQKAVPAAPPTAAPANPTA